MYILCNYWALPMTRGHRGSFVGVVLKQVVKHENILSTEIMGSYSQMGKKNSLEEKSISLEAL